MASPTFTQVAFRLRNDDGSETAATWKQNQNTNGSIQVDQNFRVRFLIDETASRSWNNFNWTLYYALNGGSYTQLTTTTSHIKIVSSSYFANGDDTTSQLTGGSGSFLTDNNAMIETANNATNTGAAGNYFEIEFCLQMSGVWLNNNEVIDLMVYNGSSPIASYTNTPRITVLEPVVISLTTPSIAASGKTTSLVVDRVVSLSTANISASGQALTVYAQAPAATVQLSTSMLSASGQVLSAVPGSITLQIAAALITQNGPPTAVLAGPITIPLSSSQVTALSLSLQVNRFVNLLTAALTFTGQNAQVNTVTDIVRQLALAQITSLGYMRRPYAPRGLIVDIDHETGNLNQYTRTVREGMK